MASYGFRERVLEVKEDGTAVANTVTQTTLLPASAKELILGAGRLKVPFSVGFYFSGRIGTVVTSPGTLALACRFGSTDVFSSGAMTLNIVAQTNVNWTLEGELVCRATGLTTVSNFMPKGCKFSSHAVIGSPAPTAGGGGVHMLPYNAAPAVGTGVDFSTSLLFDLMATWGTANASNTIQLHAGHVDVYT